MTVVIHPRNPRPEVLGAESMYRALVNEGMRESSAGIGLAGHLVDYLSDGFEPSMLTVEGTRERLKAVIDALIIVRDRLEDA